MVNFKIWLIWHWEIQKALVTGA